MEEGKTSTGTPLQMDWLLVELMTIRHSPIVTVGMPVYNGQKYLRQSVESILNQTFEDFELIICDNASTDATEEICREYARLDNRIRYVKSAENIGSSPNYNKTFELSRGHYFKWCAHDDVCRQDFLARSVDVMEIAPQDVALVFPQCDLIDGSGRLLKRAPQEPDNRHPRPFRRLARVIRNVGYAYPLWGLIRASHLRKTRLLVGGAQDDYILLGELALVGEFWDLPDVLFEMRMHEDNAWGQCARDDGGVAWRENAKASRRARQEMLTWTNPKLAEKKIWLPFYEDLYGRYLQGVGHAELPWLERLLCYGTVPAVGYFRRVKNRGAIWKRRLINFHRQVESTSRGS